MMSIFFMWYILQLKSAEE